ncbi:transcriptional regulator, HxlR family [Amphibacillus marinus]|uniref:Transcriptional regulator, HxlR family n=1 Tax=Amphibacillus marinus TaxID=872970 RepID=A0A1H8L3X5_9BACI|nr:winged helix-turn-helix transcriptional regulator [Amphibacillus marinus]SEN99809.1 transcriptional regulator, HxlR family [Amphibacillus marinus]
MDKIIPNYCMVSEPLEVLVGKWKPIILLNLLANSPMRFTEIKQAIPEITQKMLTKQLRELESHDIISRTVYPEVPPRVEYAITAHGQTLQPILDRMHQWGLAHIAHMEEKELKSDLE